MRSTILVLGIALVCQQNIFPQVPFATSPDWVSTNPSDYTTGAAWADIDQDGWKDFVVSNGNDMARQRVAVYFNENGTLETTPGWQSGDVDYHGHLSVGDINADGFPDVAVSVYLGQGGFGQRGKVKLYLNNAGTLASMPSWVSADLFYTFSCSFGDADGDGDLDLAVAGGESYYSHPERGRIYYNEGGVLETTPRWMTDVSYYSYDVTWADFDLDGDLDLAFGNEDAGNTVYENFGDSIETSPGWTSADAENANSVFAADVDNDGFIDLAVSDNNQLGGSGRFKIYMNDNGVLETLPSWTSLAQGYGSGITLADIDNDDDPDLVVGGWWEPCRIYVNDAGTFSRTPQWTSATGSVVEAIVFTDCDRDGVREESYEFISDGNTRLFQLPQSHIEEITALMFDQDTVAQASFCANLEHGWISCGLLPDSGVLVTVNATVSHDLDFAVSNWDPAIGNYVFLNTSATVYAEEPDVLPKQTLLIQNYPNPFNPKTEIRYRIPETGHVALRIYDLLGSHVATLVDENQTAGLYDIAWDASGQSSGIYFARLETGGRNAMRRLVLMK
jgi:hypothetical protein